MRSKTPRRVGSGCAPTGRQLRCSPELAAEAIPSLSGIVRSYRRFNEQGANEEREYFEGIKDLKDAIRHAGLAVDGRDKRYGHQCWIPGDVLIEVEEALQRRRKEIKACTTFHELWSLITDVTDGIHGAGELIAYDATLRLGAHLNLLPAHVYLHAGTREGAANLGLAVNRPYVDVGEFPRELQALEPEQIEDVLCIYKTHLKKWKDAHPG